MPELLTTSRVRTVWTPPNNVRSTLRDLFAPRAALVVGGPVERFWCPHAGTTVSVLPAFLAARMSDTLDAVEAAVLAVEQLHGDWQALRHERDDR